MAITITQLTTFLAVVRGGSVTAAADELVVTQPSVSSALAALGRELGCELFERAGRGIRLTDEGSAFAPYARDVLGVLEDGRQAVLEAVGERGQAAPDRVGDDRRGVVCPAADARVRRATPRDRVDA